MSKIALSPNAGGTATFTIASPGTSTDRTLTLPDTTAPILAGSGITLSASAPANTLVTTSGGNVGIGTSSPSDIVTLAGGASGSYGLTINNAKEGGGTKAAFQFDRDNGVAVVSASTTNGLVFKTLTGGTLTERVRIDSIGTSNFFANNPIFAATSAGANSTSANAIFIGYHSATSTTALGTSSIVITSNGNIFNTNGSYGSLSDAKLKENVTDATPKLDKLNQVRVVNYNLKGELGHGTHKQIGVIAQELEQIFPGMVEESPDRDAEGNDLGTTTKAVKYSVFVPMLIKAIQELNAKVDAQAAEIAALKGQA